jgi:hypothetical protein
LGFDTLISFTNHRSRSTKLCHPHHC